MSEHCFAVVSGIDVPSKAKARRRDQIARKVGGQGCGYVRVKMPDGPRAWGYVPNLGEPFDSQRVREIEAAWAEDEAC